MADTTRPNLTRVVPLLVALSLLVVSFPATATATTERYTAGGAVPFAFNTGCGYEVPFLPDNMGGACFDVPAGTDALDVQPKDDHSAMVSAWFRIEDARGQGLGSGVFCDAVSLPLPPETARLWVVMDDPVHAGLECFFNGPGPGVAAATTGTITVTYH